MKTLTIPQYIIQQDKRKILFSYICNILRKITFVFYQSILFIFYFRKCLLLSINISEGRKINSLFLFAKISVDE